MGRPKVARKTVACTRCGREVERRVTDLARLTSGRFFCSETCRRSTGSKPRTRTDRDCKQCGMLFYPRSDTQEFCNRFCTDEFQRTRRVWLDCSVCGKRFSLSPSQATLRPDAVCSRACDNLRRCTTGVGRMHNGKAVVRDASGYLRVWEPDHPSAFKGGWVLEHRLVAEQTLGRRLQTGEHVHHINHTKDDNRPENLAVMPHGEHSRITGLERKAEWEQMETELAAYRERYGPLN